MRDSSVDSSKGSQATLCYHCGAPATGKWVLDDHAFCCSGCQAVYQWLRDENLCQYYDLNHQPGLNRSEVKHHSAYSFLEVESLLQSLLLFDSESERRMRFYLPQVHCSSCLYLLENLHAIVPGVLSAQLDFERKELLVSWSPDRVSAFAIAGKLSELGYEPYFSLADAGARQEGSKSASPANQRLMRLGVAGFAFGNIMLLSFPEYLSESDALGRFASYFQYMSFALSLPVLLYSAQEFFRLGWAGIRKGHLNIDFPIVLALLVAFFRSVYEVFYAGGNGYWDSLTGIVFFMLLGRYLQDRTQYALNYDRQFESHFPLAVSRFVKGKEEPIPIGELAEGMEIILRDGDLLPVDARLISHRAELDFSFVSGESVPQIHETGSWCYAGARMVGASARFRVEKAMSQSYLVSLWKQSARNPHTDAGEQEDRQFHQWSQWFTLGVMALAIMGGIYWYSYNPSRWLEVVSSVLIVACPCTLLLAVTYAHGHAVAKLARAGLFVRNGKVLDKLARVDAVVFDKTGTLTQAHHPEFQYKGRPLSQHQIQIMGALAMESTHPYARALGRASSPALVEWDSIVNHTGQGVSGQLDGIAWKLGSAEFVGVTAKEAQAMYLSIDRELHGYWVFKSRYRTGLAQLFSQLQRRYRLALMSGDTDAEREQLAGLAPALANHMQFQMKPHNKATAIRDRVRQGEHVLMIGDGLNDAAALAEATVGVAVSEAQGQFTPASDAVLNAQALPQLGAMLEMAVDIQRIIRFAFAVSLIYNVVGLSFALSGQLQPVVAAILMPASSISMVLITALGVAISARVRHLESRI